MKGGSNKEARSQDSGGFCTFFFLVHVSSHGFCIGIYSEIVAGRRIIRKTWILVEHKKKQQQSTLVWEKTILL